MHWIRRYSSNSQDVGMAGWNDQSDIILFCDHSRDVVVPGPGGLTLGFAMHFQVLVVHKQTIASDGYSLKSNSQLKRPRHFVTGSICSKTEKNTCFMILNIILFKVTAIFAYT